ncbi:facilitated trehalose transporter Tret1 isoform X2 [Aethina tumida]|uniref:facilitated trehalose transporter Tret1 isoform X2 n=1 Tax=Aethina tumida TaxID=116153 RepID=UPI00096B536E|nr:facilitated trehalose transporter Tret1 isoform X2 [Aethina tumida]
MKSQSIFSMFQGTLPQLIAVLSGTLVAVSDGMNYGWTSPVIPILLGENSHIKTTLHECEWLEHILNIGAFSGLPVTIYLVDKIGRKKSLLLASFSSLLCWIIIALANRMEYFYVARFFCGMSGDMAFVSGPMYIAEIADHKIRGFLSSLIYLMMLFGITTIYSITPYVPFVVPSILAGILLIIELIIFPFMPESPYYLLYIGKREEAKKSLEKFRPNGNVEQELDEIAAAIKRQKSEKGRPQDLILVKSNRKALIILAILNGAQHFSSISVMIMNVHLILEAAGSIYIEKSLAAIIFAVIMLSAATVSSFFMDKYGRKVLLITSSILTGLCLLALSIYFTLKNSGVDVLFVSWIPIVSVMVYACVFKLGLGMVPIVLTAELFPAKMKAMGMTLADAMYVIFSMISIYLYQWLSQSYGIHVPFYLFSASCFFTAMFTVLFIPETKGKTLEEIQFILKGEIHPKDIEDFDTKSVS